MIFIPKKSREIYKLIIAHRGLHLDHPENTISSFKAAIDKKLAIETDVRITKDNVLVCYHDRYLRRLLNLKGKIIDYTYDELNKKLIKNSSEIVPKFEDVLKLVKGKVVLLLEIKGGINKKLKSELCRLLNTYDGKVYFHAKNILTYFYIKFIFGSQVFFVLNPFRKRFNFIKVHTNI